MKKPVFDSERLVGETLKILSSNKISDLSSIKLTRDKNNIWSQISNKYFKNESYVNSLRIYSWWKRDTGKFATIIQNKILENKKKSNFLELNEQKFIIKLSSNDINELKSFVAFNIRIKFKKEFDDFLSEKLQRFKVNCWLNCKHNWFRSKITQKKSSPFWRGVFKCQDLNCKNVFDAIIHKEPLIENKLVYEDNGETYSNEIYVTLKGNSVHEKLIKKIRCSGEKRELEALKVMAFGVSNVKSKNVLNNLIETNHKGTA